MYNTTELTLHWEDKTPISFDPDMRLTEYNMQRYWYNETIVNSNDIHLRHGAFCKYEIEDTKQNKRRGVKNQKK